jgi:hypothetical protein
MPDRGLMVMTVMIMMMVVVIMVSMATIIVRMRVLMVMPVDVVVMMVAAISKAVITMCMRVLVTMPVHVVAWIMLVIVVVTSARNVFCDQRTDALPEHEKTHSHHNQPRSRGQPGIKLLRKHIPGSKQGNKAQGQHSEGMGECDRQSQVNGVPGGAAGSDQIGADDGLAMARRQCVTRAPGHRRQQRPGNKGRAEFSAAQHRQQILLPRHSRQPGG